MRFRILIVAFMLAIFGSLMTVPAQAAVRRPYQCTSTQVTKARDCVTLAVLNYGKGGVKVTGFMVSGGSQKCRRLVDSDAGSPFTVSAFNANGKRIARFTRNSMPCAIAWLRTVKTTTPWMSIVVTYQAHISGQPDPYRFYNFIVRHK